MSKEYTVGMKFTLIGEVTVEADSMDDAIDKVEKKLAIMHSTGNLASDHHVVNWSGSELEVEGEDVDLDDMKYYED